MPQPIVQHGPVVELTPAPAHFEPAVPGSVRAESNISLLSSQNLSSENCTEPVSGLFLKVHLTIVQVLGQMLEV